MLVSNTADRVLDTFDKVPNAFTMFTLVRFLDDGSDAEKLMICADFSGIATLGMDSAIFDVAHRKVSPLISAETLVSYQLERENLDFHTLTLDEHRTLLSNGQRFVFTKKTWAEKGKVFSTPVTSSVSYPVGAGLPLDWY